MDFCIINLARNFGIMTHFHPLLYLKSSALAGKSLNGSTLVKNEINRYIFAFIYYSLQGVYKKR